FDRLTGGVAPAAERSRLHEDPVAVKVAWTAQHAVETAVLHLAGVARELTGCENLCLAGGVALNCKTNGLLGGPLYAPPVPHDAGIALGAAWHVSPPRGAAELLSPYLGPLPGAADPAGLRAGTLDLEAVADALAGGRIGAIVDGRGEAGPRALGNRSIVASPGFPGMRDRLNRVKGREPWRPFGACALASTAPGLWAARPRLDRYMLAGTPVLDGARSAIGAAVHVDGTTRPQVVGAGGDGALGRLLAAWDGRCGGALINTSFNHAGEPLVSSAVDAVDAFRRMELDFLVVGDDLLTKRADWQRPVG
ncbi:MAG TPA: carbamoyltransferase C-terminal domain-containing protein, partial [Solirubrobacteraceae bacterium]|nr:carbamoyltransferase C-terminal domain-containing protein [Solirubrobacteraceae bacterium]